MKSVYCFLLMGTLIACSSNDDSNESSENINDPILTETKSCTEEVRLLNSVSYEEGIIAITYGYDDECNLTNFFDAEGVLGGRAIYENNKVEIGYGYSYTNEVLDLGSKSVYEYDSQNRIINLYEYDLVYTSFEEYDETFIRVINFEYIDNRVVLLRGDSRTEFVLNEAELIESVTYYSEEDLHSEYSLEYDNKGNCISIKGRSKIDFLTQDDEFKEIEAQISYYDVTKKKYDPTYSSASIFFSNAYVPDDFISFFALNQSNYYYKKVEWQTEDDFLSYDGFIRDIEFDEDEYPTIFKRSSINSDFGGSSYAELFWK